MKYLSNTAIGIIVNRYMRIDDIIQPEDSREELAIIAERCSDFIAESDGHPLLKNLPSEYGDYHKVKVRLRKNRKQDTREFAERFNNAFKDSVRNLRERAIFSNGVATFRVSEDPDQEPFFIFPVDGYDYMYSREVENSSTNYKSAFDSILEQLGTNEAENIITELLKFNYTQDKLTEGIESGSEIIIYNIPYFYAIRVQTVDNYQELINNIKELV